MMEMNSTIAGYVADTNAGNVEAVAARFMPDATVEDESKTHRGIDEIRDWLRHAREEYRFTLAPLEVAEAEGGTILKCEISGTFPGSPVQLRHIFRLDGEKIAGLEIRE